MKPAATTDRSAAILRARLALLALLVLPASASAAERIIHYDVLVEIATDASLTITEKIEVRAEGDTIRRGLYRDFPTRYRDRFGNRVMVDFEVLGVERDGRAEPYFIESLANGVRINTGDDSFLRVPADYVYSIRYRTNRQLGFFETHDELYWNAIGTGWAFPIDGARVEVRLPSAVDEDRLSAEGYTGAQGEQGSNYRARIESAGVERPTVAIYELTRGLPPYEGFTVVLGFPKGIVTAPTRADQAGWFLRDNAGAGVALFGVIGMLVFYLRRWHRLGRDPRPGVIFPRYEAPQGLSPGLLRYVRASSYSPRCFAADLVDLAVHGLLRIEREKARFSETWSIERSALAPPDTLPASQRTLLARLFAGGARLELKQANHQVLGAAKAAHAAALKAAAEPRYFVRNYATTGLGALMSSAIVVLAFVLATGDDAGMLLIVGCAVLLFAMTITFLVLMYQPTREGRELLDAMEGLRQYLAVAERDELKGLAGPGAPKVDVERYEQLLPYALALDVEEAWTKRLTRAIGAAAAAEAGNRMHWYSSGGASIGSIGEVGKALGSSLSSTIASSSSPPGSSSGGGGGGSSGGGGGGGGGGGR